MADERISWFPVLADDELDEPERKLFAKAGEVVGFVPNVFRTYAWRPERFRAWFAHFKTVMEGTPGLSARERAMLDYAVKVTKDPGACEESDIEALRAEGFSDADIWDVIEVAAMYNFTNRLAMATGMMPNREYHDLAR